MNPKYLLVLLLCATGCKHEKPAKEYPTIRIASDEGDYVISAQCKGGGIFTVAMPYSYANPHFFDNAYCNRGMIVMGGGTK